MLCETFYCYIMSNKPECNVRGTDDSNVTRCTANISTKYVQDGLQLLHLEARNDAEWATVVHGNTDADADANVDDTHTYSTAPRQGHSLKWPITLAHRTHASRPLPRIRTCILTLLSSDLNTFLFHTATRATFLFIYRLSTLATVPSFLLRSP